MNSGNLIYAQTYYYSNNNSGDFNDPSGWGINLDGSGSNPSSLNNTCILVLNHTKTTSGIATIRGLQIKSGGILFCNYSIFLDGSGKFFKIDSAGTYVQQHVGSLGAALFSGTETFEKGSIAEFRLWPAQLPGASWGFLKFNNNSNTANCQLSGNTSTIKNDLIINAGSGTINLSGASNLNINIEGNLDIQSGSLDIANSAGNSALREVHLWGNLLLSNGNLKCTGTSNAVQFFIENSADTIQIDSGTFNTNNFKLIIQSGVNKILKGNLTIQNNCSLSLANSSTSFQILSGYVLKNNGIIITNGGNFEFLSNIEGTAMLGESTGAYSGNLKFNQTIPAGWKRYRFVSSPIVNAHFTDLIDDIYITGPGGKQYGFDSTQTNNSSAFYYDETVSLPDANYGWEPIYQTSNQMNTGKGFRVLIRGDRSNTNVLYQNIPYQGPVNLDFTGMPNSGNIPISSIASYTTSGTSTADGWNLLGNPYACNIDWNLIYDQSDFTNVNPSIYQRDAKSGNYVAWNAASNSGTGSQFVSPFAGFLIQFNQTPSGNFKETHKTVEQSPQYFKTETEETIIEVKDSASSDLLLIGQKNGANSRYRAIEDILKLFSAGTFIAAKSSDNNWLCGDIRQKPLNSNDTIDIIIGAKSKVKLKVVKHTSNSTLQLFKKSSNQKFNLTKDFELEMQPGEMDSINWKIIVSPNNANEINEVQIEDFEILPNPFQDKIEIKSNYRKNNRVKISIIDLSGKELLMEDKYEDKQEMFVETTRLIRGIYILVIETEGGNKFFKKMIKN
jgi:hypothetical protein